MDETIDPVEEQFWREAGDQLTLKVTDMTRAVELCLKEDLWEKEAILMLVFVDACAWLARPPERLDVGFTDFVGWVDLYLLPDSGLDCTAEELYGARCGLLHSLTTESRLHRAEKIRKIYWGRAGDDGSVHVMIQLLMNEKFLPTIIGVDHFRAALHRALQRFGDAIDNDEALARRVADRVRQSYTTKVRSGG